MRNITYQPTKLRDSIICEFESTKPLLECGGSLTTSQPDEVKRSFVWTALEIQVVELFYKVLVHPETWKTNCSLLAASQQFRHQELHGLGIPTQQFPFFGSRQLQATANWSFRC